MYGSPAGGLWRRRGGGSRVYEGGEEGDGDLMIFCALHHTPRVNIQAGQVVVPIRQRVSTAGVLARLRS